MVNSDRHGAAFCGLKCKSQDSADGIGRNLRVVPIPKVRVAETACSPRYLCRFQPQSPGIDTSLSSFRSPHSTMYRQGQSRRGGNLTWLPISRWKDVLFGSRLFVV